VGTDRGADRIEAKLGRRTSAPALFAYRRQTVV
jgi:hypothetical protein